MEVTSGMPSLESADQPIVELQEMLQRGSSSVTRSKGKHQQGNRPWLKRRQGMSKEMFRHKR